MQKVDLEKVLEMLINEEQDQATGLLHQWFVDKSKSVHEILMQEDEAVLEDNLSQEIEDDKDEIETEEHFSVAEADGDEEEAVADAGEELPADDLDVPAEVAPEAAEDRVEDLEARLEFLKAEFAKITQVADLDQPLDASGDDEVAPEAGAGEFGDLEVAPEMGDDLDEPKEESLAFEAADDEFADLEESFKLEPVKDPALNGGKEIGASGASLNVNDKSPIPQKKGEARVGGKAVEIKAQEHKGYAREASPEVKARPLLKNQVKKATDDLEAVSAEGDKSAKLNSKDGFGSDSPKSPIGAGAADLRGSDLKRK